MRAASQRGAALITAMLTVVLVATLASAALWQQWRNVALESAERNRTQMQWILNGALDWARLILREDARDGQVDHLSEPWALPLQEARLSSFLAADKNHSDDTLDAFLSGQVTDLQGLLNVRNLVREGKPQAAAVQAFERLFTQLRLPRAQLTVLVDNLVASQPTPAAKPEGAASAPAAGAPPIPDGPLKPSRWEQLTWFGLSPATLRALSPYATFLPQPTPLNLNTASAEVLAAALPGLDRARAQQVVATRATGHFKTVGDGFKAAGVAETGANPVDASAFSVGSRYFAVRGRLRLGDTTVQEVSVVEREGPNVRVLWRLRESLATPLAASLQ